MDDKESERRVHMVASVREMHLTGVGPALLVRYVLAQGVVGLSAIHIVVEALEYPAQAINAIQAWMHHGDDARLDRYLVRYMPRRPGPAT